MKLNVTGDEVKKLKILVLDDNSDMCELMKEVLGDFGCENILLSQSFEQTESYQSEIDSIDVAFLDVNLGMGKKNGIEVYHWLMEQGYPGKVVFFTGHAGSYPALTELINNSNVSLLEKPVSIELIEKVINGI